MYNEEEYDAFEKRMKESYPEMFSRPYGGIAVGKGWWPVISALCSNIYAHIEYVKNRREWAVKNDHPVPELVPPVIICQIKEKFGGLRFYYDGGDDQIHGMVQMAESWAARSCEECGAPGEPGGSGWIRTLCPTHRAEADAAYKARFGDED